ncbi:MAG: gluconate 2-dehydrogenase subunit 3 family protein [Gammaproteobacteria bacterium]
MSAYDPTRREFLRNTGTVFGASWLTARWPVMLAAGQTAATAHAALASFKNLDTPDAADLLAIAAQIIPSDDTPGATEAGVIYFIDEAIGSFMSDQTEIVLEGLADLNEMLIEQHGVARFAELDNDRQIEVLTAIEDTPFFGTVRFMTLVGMFAMPSYGGNRDHIGWDLLGFDHKHGWQPPFGYYDAEAAKKESGRG